MKRSEHKPAMLSECPINNTPSGFRTIPAFLYASVLKRRNSFGSSRTLRDASAGD